MSNQLIGITKPGALCYINVCLHVIHKIEPLKNAILSLNKELCSSVIKELRSILIQLDEGLIPPDPLSFFHASGFSNSILTHHDSHEFLTFLLVQIQDELKRLKPDCKLVEDTLGLNTVTTTTWNPAGKTENKECHLVFYIKFESEGSISQGLLSTKFDKVLYKPNADLTVEAERELKCSSVSPVLILSIPRIRFDTKLNKAVKNFKFLQINEKLDIFDLLTPEAQESHKDTSIYKLKGIICHQGIAGGGHYVFLFEINGQWVKFDDTNVTIEGNLNSDLYAGVGFQETPRAGSETAARALDSFQSYQLIYFQEDRYDSLLSSSIINNNEIAPSPLNNDINSPTNNNISPRSNNNNNNNNNNNDEETPEIRAQKLKAALNQTLEDIVEGLKEKMSIIGQFPPKEFLHSLICKMNEELGMPIYNLVEKAQVLPSISFSSRLERSAYETDLDDSEASLFADLLTFTPILKDIQPVENNNNDDDMDSKRKQIAENLPEINFNQNCEEISTEIQSFIKLNAGKWNPSQEGLPKFPGMCSECLEEKESLTIFVDDFSESLCEECWSKRKVPFQLAAKKRKAERLEGRGNDKEKEKKKRKTKKKKTKESNQQPIKKFVCTFCGHSFLRNFFLQDHIKSHTGVKDHICTICKCGFARKRTLQDHMVTHTGVKDHICTICQRSFALKQSLQSHMVVHSGVKDHICTICQRSFARKRSLHSHMKIHTGVKDHICPTCGREFRRKNALKVHQKVCKGKTKFFCDLCKHGFKSRRTLYQHNTRFHKKEMDKNTKDAEIQE